MRNDDRRFPIEITEDHFESVTCESNSSPDEKGAIPTCSNEMPSEPWSRPFLISDLMIVIAGIAVTIAFSRLWARELSAQLPTFKLGGHATGFRTRFAGHALGVMIPATLAVLSMRLTKPRPALNDLIRMPGSVALWAATLIVAIHSISLPLDINTMGGLTSPMIVAAFYWPTAIFSGICACWSVLVISGEWNSTDDWIDRLGILVGICWIGLFAGIMLIEFVLY